ncbi:hypothetical protein GW17_00038161 [Ensete ventricosum]|nr:hypothetical protein GW17_00038161 [Ensete ventricosum]
MIRSSPRVYRRGSRSSLGECREFARIRPRDSPEVIEKLTRMEVVVPSMPYFQSAFGGSTIDADDTTTHT